MITAFNNCMLQKIGISQCGVIDVSQIPFGEEIRQICEANSCQNYGRSWACPPAVGTVEECRELCLGFEKALVFNAVYPLEDSFDWEGMQRGHLEFKTVCDRLYMLVQNKLEHFKILSNEGCRRCQNCSYPKPCRYPEKLFPALESYGIYVSQLAEAARVSYNNGVNTVTYFGMLLYDQKG